MNKIGSFLDNYFEITKRNSTIKKEILAGIVVFLSMAYILAVMPATFNEIGMDTGAVFTATALSACIASLFMGVYAKYPVALAPGMGMQAFFAYTLVIQMGYSWEEALFGIFVSGIIFMLLSLTGLRKKIINVIPEVIKVSVTIGIGFFIAFIGMQNVGIIVGGATLVELGNFANPVTFLAVVGILITLVLVHKNINGAIFLGMLATGIIGMIMQLFGIDIGMQIPSSIVSAPKSIEPIFGKLFTIDPISLLTDIHFWVVVFSILFVDFFDTAGTILAVGGEAGTIDEEGNIKDSEKILLVDSTSTVIGSILGVSSVTSYIESLVGIKMGGRTGLSAVVVSFLFLISIFFSPILSLIVAPITAPALIVIGILMSMNHGKIDYSKFINSATAFITVGIMVLSYSISNGLAAGVIVYTILSLFDKEERKLHPIMYILTFVFILYFI